MSERSLEQFHKGELVEGMVFHREPGEHVDVLQVQVSEDEYYEIIDKQIVTEERIMQAIDPQQHGKSTPEEDGNYWVQSGGMGTPIECSLPEGAEWDVKYSLEGKPKTWYGPNDRMRDIVHDKSVPTFADVYDITRATPNNMELGELIRNMVNESDE